MEISVIIPAYNEAENLEILINEVVTASAGLPLREIVVVDDASDDATWEVLRSLQRKFPSVRPLRHKQRSGQSTALRTGAQAARGMLLVTMDGDGQNDPADLPRLYKQYIASAMQNPRLLVAGQRAKRQDNLLRRFSSRGANKIRSALLKDGVRDTGCSLKLFRREDFLAIPFFDHLHRFIPAMMKMQGVEIVLVDVGHRPRLRGVSKYGFWDRLWVGIADLFGVRWLMARHKAPVEVIEP